MIAIERLSKAYGSLVVLRDVNTTINAGEVVVIIGPSGSGKSTLLRCLGLLEPIDTGVIRVDGRPYLVGARERGERVDRQARKEMRTEIGLVFQQFNLFPHMTVRRNVTLAPVRVRRMTRQAADDLAVGLL